MNPTSMGIDITMAQRLEYMDKYLFSILLIDEGLPTCSELSGNTIDSIP
jgi:hypothetical protein